jgi:hypothetical protein
LGRAAAALDVISPHRVKLTRFWDRVRPLSRDGWAAFTSAEVVYRQSVLMWLTYRSTACRRDGGGDLAILRSGFGATKESEVAAVDIVPVVGEMFEQTLASKSPDVLREMIREIAQRMVRRDAQDARVI